MSENYITVRELADFQAHLYLQERSAATVEKYMRDVRAFAMWLGGQAVCKEAVMAYKNSLTERYNATSANSMLAAVNGFLSFIRKQDCRVKQFKVQRNVFCPEAKELTKAEYKRLLNAANRKENQRLGLVLQTICATGIRVSELRHITAEAVKNGSAEVRCKGKTRTVFLNPQLRRLLCLYMKKAGITSGAVFVSRGGKPLDRSNIWRDMKSLCQSAGVDASKVFPHNLRHLFARTFYGLDKDIAKLADILGHSSIETTRLYIISTGREHQRQLTALGLVL